MGGFPEVAKRIQEARETRRWTQQELADRCGVHRVTVAKWETQGQVPFRKLEVLAKALDVGPKWLLSGDAIDHPQIIKSRVPSGDLMRDVIVKMPSFEIREYPEAGLAAAAGHDRDWDSSQLEPGKVFSVDAIDPRVITARGSSAEDLARDGQQVVIDAAVTNVAVSELCVVLTRDGNLRLKRKAKDVHGKRRYQSVNPDFPTFEIPPREVVAEFPVVTVLIRSRSKSPIETFDEGFPT